MKIEVSDGEIVDKMTILKIKEEKCSPQDHTKLTNIQRELRYLEKIVEDLSIPIEMIKQLEDINRKLWDIEDDIRVCESKFQFDDEFISLARLVYYTNDKRFEMKNKINSLTLSYFKEEKILPTYA
jgi:hypothetical protein